MKQETYRNQLHLWQNSFSPKVYSILCTEWDKDPIEKKKAPVFDLIIKNHIFMSIHERRQIKDG